MPLTSVADRLRESMWRSANDKRLKRLRRVVEAMPEDPPEVPARLDVTGDAELAGFLALAGEVAGREVGLAPFPNQYLATAALLRGFSIELATGEGKTLVGAMAAAGWALEGRHVHVLTANDYLAARDADWMGPLYRGLGLTCAAVQADQDLIARQVAYAADITYSSVAEAGFDLLRDRLAARPGERTGARREVVLVDEADAVLLDEARVPLVLAADAEPHRDEHALVLASYVRGLEAGRDYVVAPDRRTVHLTDDGLRRVEDDHPDRDLFGSDSEFLVSLNLALHAHAALERDVDYLVADDRVWLVSGSRGRVDRLQRWPDGLQLAVEAKEALETAPGLQVLDQLVIAELVGGYDKLVGMSATMRSAEEELESLYGLQVAVIPSHLPCRRTDHPTRLHATSEHRDAALADLVRDSGERGRPVLVATQSVRESERIADLLRGLGVECVLLNARNATEEAAIISRAGEAGRVTVSTQMAGRGTDVVPSPEAVDAGGLLVVGVGRFPSARLDDQLRGRAGRQGDPGESVFLASLEDRLVTDNDPDHPDPAVVDGDGEVEQCRANRRVLGVVDHAQRISDGEQRNLRWLSWRYGELLRRQRAHLVEVRETCLEGPEALDRLVDHAPEEVAELDERVGEDELEAGARLALVAAIDAAWSAHLGHAAELREGIHLRVLAREDPLTEFEKEMGAAYQGLAESILDDAVATLLEAPVVDGRLDLESLGSRIPSATWAYTVTDNELGDDFTRMGRALRRRLAGGR